MGLHLATFSIVGHCTQSGMLGVAVSTAVPAVGALCPHVKAGVGAVSTQSWVNPYLAIEALQLMERGAPGPEALEQVLAADDGADLRQIGVVDAQGRSASWSGDGCTSWYGHITEENFAVQGNMLVGEATLTAMAEAFRDSAPLDLAERLLLALEAGNAAGGDKRGKQSAALVIQGPEPYTRLNMRVDDHAEPFVELRRLYGVAQERFIPFSRAFPTPERPYGITDRGVIEKIIERDAGRPLTLDAVIPEA